ncbi:MAG: GatB/YqeY domain-containing protein [Candidatus Pacebacteria bacterium]|nr:GatB/YqeY domain-containing protein [Candidatus Paceibacterota bacterium]MBP9851508.1 GatB/YqeY domain-containing protein [Candidatus Paceibacterota bacterium]
MLHQEIKSGIKEAMMTKNEVLLKALRNMVAAFMTEVMTKGRKPDEFLTDEEVIAVITKLSKQRKDSIEQFKKGGREDLVKEEEAELAILEKYLPAMMDQSEVEKLAKMKQTELGLNDVTKKGILMAALMKDLKGKADGSVVKTVVDSLF